uniref:Uncharacterized protein n=4 Tax=Vibrionaceae TaxID=641 RepID=A0A0H3ZSQ9_9VIBR|nr:hypothetical protein [Vibrio sp. FF_304]AKN36872.1 hypothetical protein [Enterovibrio norvegicus]AKN38668.1 hypothetical protein [Vibrio sp. F12 FF_152]AKN39418.1 hypothetical protein [Vibrio tasmaniensis]
MLVMLGVFIVTHLRVVTVAHYPRVHLLSMPTVNQLAE